VPHSSQEQDARQSYDNAPVRLAAFLAYLGRVNPDLAAVVRAWPKLPAPIRAGILATVRASRGL
jgi:hypothetical protein